VNHIAHAAEATKHLTRHERRDCTGFLREGMFKTANAACTAKNGLQDNGGQKLRMMRLGRN